MENQPLYEENDAEVIATNQAVKLTCTLSAFSGLFALFLLFADKSSKAVKRVSIQSVGLTGTFVFFAAICGLLIAVLGFIPILGTVINFFIWLVLCAGAIVSIVFKVRLALYAYRGLGYTIPVIGGSFRKFED